MIALAHLGIEADCVPYTSSDVINNTTGIDAMLDGHSHVVMESESVKNKSGKSIILTSTGTKLANIGCLTISADGKLSAKLINDGGVGETIKEVEAEYEELVDSVLASTDVELVIYDPNAKDKDGNPIRLIRRQETNLGDLCADAYRAAVGGADVGLINGGGVRDDIAAGDITYGQIITVNPFGNEICKAEVTGQQLLDALEMGAAALPGESGSFLQVSGVTYDIDLNVPSSVKLDENGGFVEVTGEYRVKNVVVGDKPLDIKAAYTLASHNYVLKEPDGGFTMFRDCPLLLDCVISDYQALINYITDGLGGSVGAEYADPYGDGRINVIEAK